MIQLLQTSQPQKQRQEEITKFQCAVVIKLVSDLQRCLLCCGVSFSSLIPT